MQPRQLRSTMDVTKIAKLALQFSQTLPVGHERKEQLVNMATEWTANHRRNPMTLNALNDAREIQVKAVRVFCLRFTSTLPTEVAVARRTIVGSKKTSKN